MRIEIIEKYLDSLIENSTPDIPAWNIEAAIQGKKSGWNYVDGCMILAILEMWKATRQEKYLEFAESYMSHRVREDGTIEGYDPEEYNLDHVNAGKTLFILYDATGKEKYRKAADLIYRQLERQPRTYEGNFWHKKIYPNQVWLDGLYMSQPFYMEYIMRNDKKSLCADIYSQFFRVAANMKDKKTGLYYHAYDASREMFWCDRETGLSQNFWLRALGWFSMAMLDTLCQADPDCMPHSYDTLKYMFADLMKNMLNYQDESGMWYQVVDMAGREKNYPETSGSAIMAYCMLKGVRLGFLPAEYQKHGQRAFEGICRNCLREEDGKLSLGGICLSAGLGGPQRRDGSYEYYMSEPVVKDDAKGVGPFLLAYAQLRREEE